MAFRLGTIPKAVDTIDLPLGVKVSVRPITTPIWHQAQAFASRAILAFIEGEEIRDDLGIDRDAVPDLDDPDAKEGFRQLLFTQSLARAAIISWEGVLAEEGSPAPVTPAAINELMLVHAFAEAFVIRYTARIIRALDEGNASGPSSNGTSATGHNTAKRVATSKPTARKAGAASMAGAAPMSRMRPSPNKATQSGH
ncbi:MAG: hypothetical protein U1E67_11590 [Hyphomicrobiales bacterium]